MPAITVRGLDYWAEVEGSGPPVVLLHGFTGTHDTWRSLVADLRDEFTTIAVDHIGHGRTAAPREVDRYAMASTVDDLVAVAEQLGAPRAAWVGYSLGGRTALQVVARHPEAVAALVTEGASAGLATEAERRARIAADEDLATMIEQQGLATFVDHWESLALWDSQKTTLTDKQRAALRAQRLGQQGIGLANSLRGMGTGAQAWLGDDLAAIRVPVLLTAGRLDTKYTELADEMARSIPGARVHIVEGGGHAAHLERPDDFNRAVVEFLRSVRAAI